jgi:hypothetical protein
MIAETLPISPRKPPAWPALSIAGLRNLDLPGDVRDVIWPMATTPRRGGSERLRIALEARTPPRAHRAPAAGEGFQRFADRSRTQHRRGRAMSIDVPGEPENLIAAAIDPAKEIRDALRLGLN